MQQKPYFLKWKIILKLLKSLFYRCNQYLLYIGWLQYFFKNVSNGPYRNDPKFSDRYAWANNADPDQTAPTGAVWSGSTLFAIPSASFGLITLW